METKQIITGQEANKSLHECIELMNGMVSQFRCAGRSIYNTGIYIRGRSYHPVEGKPAHKDIYVLTADGLETLCFNTLPHRALKALTLYSAGQLGDVSREVWDNYTTNGHSTRRGLTANYTQKHTERIDKIARSHADYLGQESGNSTADHNARKLMRY